MGNLTEPQKRVIAAKIAKELWLAHPTSGTYARNGRGRTVSIDSPQAECWCASGAVHKASRYVRATATATALSFAEVIGDNVVALNDTGRLTPAHWDTWIAKLEAEAK